MVTFSLDIRVVKKIATKFSEQFNTSFEEMLSDVYYSVIICYNKQLINGHVLIDDAVHNLLGGKYHKILYNTNVFKDFNARRLKIWNKQNKLFFSLYSFQDQMIMSCFML